MCTSVYMDLEPGERSIDSGTLPARYEAYWGWRLSAGMRPSSGSALPRLGACRGGSGATCAQRLGVLQVPLLWDRVCVVLRPRTRAGDSAGFVDVGRF